MRLLVHPRMWSLKHNEFDTPGLNQIRFQKIHKTHHHCGTLNKSLLLQVTKQKSSGKLNTAGPPNVALSQQCTVFLVFCLIEKLGQVQLPSQLKVTYLEEKKQKK